MAQITFAKASAIKGRKGTGQCSNSPPSRDPASFPLFLPKIDNALTSLRIGID